ncbi:Non-functional pseudokinase ZED1 [Vitis vinifera]|uniref:Non-functional pseudokinase ZED1 n=1 Tax=Vitis vinifera TaxID=29760 RepID=A0A438D7T8_VITVI|nr:Non-functional pseudokinase ZED1 [Vitis vinifera]
MESRLRIAYDIANVIAYLHIAFPRSIIHTDIKPSSFFLDQDCAAKLSDFSLSITLPEGECMWRMKFVELLDTWLLRLLSQPRGIHEELQFQAIFDLAMRCSMKDMDERPTIVNAAKEVRRIQKFVP